VSEADYSSGEDYVVEFLGYRFHFNEIDFEERVTAAAVRLGLLPHNELDGDERADLVELAADGRIVEPRSGLGRYLVRNWEYVALMNGESLVYWLRKLVFRGAWLDQRVKSGLLDVTWDETAADFGYRGRFLNDPRRSTGRFRRSTGKARAPDCRRRKRTPLGTREVRLARA
jgi:hypothetical protein